MKKGKGGAGALKGIVFALCGVLALEGFLYFVLRPGMHSIQVTYVGLEQYGEADFAPILRGREFQNWIKFNVHLAAERIAGLSGIDSVVVEKHFPDKVIIQVRERRPVAMTLANVENRTVPVFLDQNGAVFTKGISAMTHASNLPLLSGITVEQSQGGMRLPKVYQPLIDQLSDLRNTTVLSALSEIRVREKTYGTYDLEVYPIHSRTHVLLDKGLNEDSLHYMMVVLDVVNSLMPEVPVIDLRYGAASYRGLSEQTRRLF
jgi:cell division protein FtsQ